MKLRARTVISKILLWVLTLNGVVCFSPAAMTARAQEDNKRRIIIVNADQPNLWTLEQAHYLLAQMHRRNLDLRAKKLDELDANEIAGLRFDVMRMLVEFGATFNQADLAANRVFARNQEFNEGRREKLATDRARLSDSSVNLSGQIKDLELEKADTEDADQKKRLDAKIAALTTHQTKVDKEIESIDAEMETLNASSGQLKATEAGATFDANKLPKSTFDKAFEEAAAKQIEKFNQAPKINASLQLDNFIQMQYEIISKQLSLLRDELGPGERLVFLELPQTVNAAHHQSKRKWAQSWWKIAGYTRREQDGYEPVSPLPTPLPFDLNYEPIKTSQDFDSILQRDPNAIRLPVTCVKNEATPHANSHVIAFGDGKKAGSKPVASEVKVFAAPGSVSKVTVKLYGLRHTSPQNLNLLLVGPQGQNALIMSDVGGALPARDLDIELDDAAGSSLSPAGPLTSGRFKPTDYNPANNALPDPAPAPLGGSSLSVFNGTNPKGAWTLYAVDDTGKSAGSIVGGWSLGIATDCMSSRPRPKEIKYKDVFVNLDGALNVEPELEKYLTKSKAVLSNRQVRTVDLIPRQGSLNVNDMNLKVKSGAFNFVLSTLFGFGSRLNVQRQREQFSQFVQQELYSAAFGKGAREFGWTFTPMPGMDRLVSGVRTTYAVVVVPDDATSLVLESNGCYFPRSQYEPNNFQDTKSPRWNESDRTSRNCGGPISKAFVVPIPSARVKGGNEFWIDKINFRPVAKGKRVVVEIGGKNFSPQTGVLIDGQPLVQTIGLAQPLIRDDSAAGRATADEFKGAEIQGSVERVDPEKIIFWFKMPPDFKGTPTITLIAPGRATDINSLPNVKINRGPETTLDAYPTKMIGNEKAPDDFRIAGLRVFRSQTSGRLTAVVTGAGFINATATPSATSDTVAQVLVNGAAVGVRSFESPTLMTLDFPPTGDETIKVTMISKGSGPKKEPETVESDAVANPARLSVSGVEVVTYEAAADEDPAVLVVKITGTGFTDKLKATIGTKTLDVAVKSTTEALLTITDPKAVATVALVDEGTNQTVRTVVVRKTKPKE